MTVTGLWALHLRPGLETPVTGTLWPSTLKNRPYWESGIDSKGTIRYNDFNIEPEAVSAGMDNRSKLLTCALQLFAARGYDAVGVQEIVETAGVTKPTLYHYFGSKQGVLEALLAEAFAELDAAVTAAAAYRHNLPLTLDQVAKAYFHYAREHRLYYRMQLSMWFAPVDSAAFKAVARLNEKQQQTMEDLFVRAAADHGNMRGRQRAYAATFLGMINTYITLGLNGYVELDDALVYTAVHQFMHGIFS